MLSKLFNLPWPPGFFWKGCPCCPDCSLVNCSGTTLEFTVAGVTNDDCITCDGLNATYTLAGFTGVSWSDTSISTTCSGFGGFAILLCSVGFPMRLQIQLDSFVIVEWTFNGEFDCDAGPFVFTLKTNNSKCSDWPSTVTVTKV